MMWLVRHGFPFRQIVRSLFLNVGLCVDAVLSSELLRDRVLDFDALDGFGKIRERLAPGMS